MGLWPEEAARGFFPAICPGRDCCASTASGPLTTPSFFSKASCFAREVIRSSQPSLTRVKSLQEAAESEEEARAARAVWGPRPTEGAPTPRNAGARLPPAGREGPADLSPGCSRVARAAEVSAESGRSLRRSGEGGRLGRPKGRESRGGTQARISRRRDAGDRQLTHSAPPNRTRGERHADAARSPDFLFNHTGCRTATCLQSIARRHAQRDRLAPLSHTKDGTHTRANTSPPGRFSHAPYAKGRMRRPAW